MKRCEAKIDAMQITSVQNPRVKAAAKLRNSRDRARQQRIIIDGLREIGRALDGGIELREIFVNEDDANTPAVRDLLGRIKSTSAERFEVTSAVFAKLAYGDRTEGLVAIADLPTRTLADLNLTTGSHPLPLGDLTTGSHPLPLGEGRGEGALQRTDLATEKAQGASILTSPPLIAVLEGVEKPGNIGAVLRSADGAGISAVIVADGGADLYNPNTIRASLGTIFTLPTACATSQETLAWLRENHFTLFAARVEASVDYTTCNFTQPTALILGSESQGLTPTWHAPDITPIRLPMLGTADSLNVSTTAAILFYEALRQRTANGTA